MSELAELSSFRADEAAAGHRDLAHARSLLDAEIRAAREGCSRPGRAARSFRGPYLRRGASLLPRPRLALRLRLTAALATGAVAAVAVAAGAGVLAAQPGHHAPGGGRAGHTVLTAAYVLDQAAAAATRQPAPRPGQYVSMSSVTTSLGTMAAAGGRGTQAWLTTSDRQIWLSVSGRTAGALRISPQGRTRLPWGGQPPPNLPSTVIWEPVPASACPARTQGTYAYLAALPTDLPRLRAWVVAHAGGGKLSADDRAWKEILSLLTTMPVPPKVAAALFHVAATIPGATVVRHVTDTAGRNGIAVARLDESSHANSELVFAPGSYRFLGEQSVLASPVEGWGPAGTVIGSSARLNVRVADHLPRSTPTFRHSRSGTSAAGC